MITAEKRKEIEDELDLLEKEERMTVLWACESGSRAWGFESKDSDYDVRFIYLRKTEAYLRASGLRDVIEKPISNDLDISGWDLPKALGLFRKSNPPFLEWLQPPIVYRKHDEFHESTTKLMPDYFSPAGCMYHYMSMADRNRKSYLDKEEIKLKRYFYMLRPVLACMWIERGFGIPPIEFKKLLNRLLPDGEPRLAIDALTERKMNSDEADVGAQVPIISNFILSQIEQFTEVTKDTQFTKAWGPLDDLFRRFLTLVNGDRIEPVEADND